MTKPNTNTAGRDAGISATERSTGGFGGWLATLQSAFEAFPAAGSLTEADIKAASPQELATACAFLHEVLNEGAEAVKAIGDHATCGVALWAQAMVSGDCDFCGEEGFDDAYFGDDEDELRQLESNKRYWAKRLEMLDGELKTEPKRIRELYEIKATRLEPIGLIYLWPATG